MIPVDQDKFGWPDGNCFDACVASILELRLDEVPHFNSRGEQWYQYLTEWLAERGLEPRFYEYDPRDPKRYSPPGYTIVGGVSPRHAGQRRLHACVARDGALVHDPNPARHGLLNVLDYLVICGKGGAWTRYNGPGEGDTVVGKGDVVETRTEPTVWVRRMMDDLDQEILGLAPDQAGDPAR